MHRRFYLLLVTVAAGIALGWWLTRRATEPTRSQPQAVDSTFRPPTIPAPVPPAPVAPAPLSAPPAAITPPPVVVPGSRPTVRIQDGKTIDFSSGKPVVKDSGEEKAIIDSAVKEMDEAAKNVRFSPNAPKPEEQKKSPAPSGG